MFRSIAIDGPAGAGKSTIAKKLANKINFNYLDTGAMYRTVTYYFLKNNLDISDEDLVNSHLNKINIKIKDNKFYLDDEDVNELIRSDQVTKNVSLVSSYRLVREKLVDMQREIAKESDIILDGRDIGSHVLKDASIKFYLTADAMERAKRRLKDIDDENITLEKVYQDILKRDEYDMNREITPLVQAEDAILIDSTDIDIDGVIELMISYLEKENVL